MELRFPHGRTLALDRPRIMGVLNVTPDSFSDGGRFTDLPTALAHAGVMLDQGVDIIDIGGESTRPGAQRIPAAEQIARVQPVVAAVRRLIDERGAAAAISIDTTLAPVAEAALEAGADMLNDIAAGRDDPGIFALAARRGVPLALMHMLGEPATMQQHPTYTDVVAEVRAFLVERAAAAERAGVDRSQIVIDPGIGFGKTLEHNLTLLAHLDELVATGYAVMLGASRKRFLRTICGIEAAGASPELAVATSATTALGVVAGVRRQIGVVLQSSRINTGSIFDNITGGLAVSMEEAWEAAEDAGLADDIRDMPMGMHTMISEGGGNISGGQRQRLFIARALVKRPRILLLDEATSALDNRTQQIVSRSLARRNVTRIVIAHRLSTIRDANRIYILERGRIVDQGTYDQLKRTHELFAMAA